MQCPTSAGLEAFTKACRTPDDLDLLATAKNHDVKSSIASHSDLDDWLFSLVSLQTMSGYLGAGKPSHRTDEWRLLVASLLGVDACRRRGGRSLGSRHPSDDRSREMPCWKSSRTTSSPKAESALLWLESWDGLNSARIGDLDPYFIEVWPSRTPRSTERADLRPRSHK